MQVILLVVMSKSAFRCRCGMSTIARDAPDAILAGLHLGASGLFVPHVTSQSNAVGETKSFSVPPSRPNHARILFRTVFVSSDWTGRLVFC